VLPEMPGPFLPGVDGLGVAAVGQPHSAGQGVGTGRNRKKVDMVGHEAVGPDLQAVGDGVLAQEAKVAPPVFVAEEDVFPAVAPVGDVVRKSDRDRARETSHSGLTLLPFLLPVKAISYPVPETC